MADIDVIVEAEGWRIVPALETCVVTAAKAAIQAAAPGAARHGAVAILLADDAALRRLNATFRQKDAPTNVLSFPAAKAASPHPDDPVFLGDVALACETCIAEAEAEGKSTSDHLRHLVVHGVLHLLGYDHATDTEAETMERLERDALASLGIADPYAGAGEGASA